MSQPYACTKFVQCKLMYWFYALKEITKASFTKRSEWKQPWHIYKQYSLHPFMFASITSEE